jgi:ribosomal protein L30
MAKLLITYTKSGIGYSKNQKATIRSLGLRKLNSSVIQDDTPAIRGMVFAVRHLVRVEEVADDAQLPGRAAPRKPVVRAAQAAVAAGDDIEVVEGIGPKVASVLRDAGIATFAQLAAAEVSDLRKILADAKLSMAVPDSWPEQAALAAAGRFDELKLLQERLVGGRRESE